MDKRIGFIVVFLGVILGYGNAWANDPAPLISETLNQSTELQSQSVTPDIVVLDSDDLTFDSESRAMSATGNVAIRFQDIRIYADSVSIDPAVKLIKFPGKVWLTRPNQLVRAQNVKYDYAKNAGKAEQVLTELGGIYISGSEVEFDPAIIKITSASYTTCNPDDKLRYRINSAYMEFYPMWGMILAYNDTFFINSIPVFWFPTYVYGSKTYAVFGHNLPIPEIGSNATEGVFIHSKFTYLMNRDSYGNVLLGYASNLGWELGFTHALALSGNRSFNARLNYIQHKGPYGGFSGALDYMWDLSQSALASPEFSLEKALLSFTPLLNLPVSRVKATLTYQELIENSWVSILPGLIFENRCPEIWPETNLNFTLTASDIYESDKAITREHESLLVGTDIQLDRAWRGNEQVQPFASGHYIGYWYSQFRPWQRLFGTVGVDFPQVVLSPEVSYTRSLYLNGSSGFEYMAVNTAQSDELGFKLHLKLKANEFEWSGAWNTIDHQWRALAMSAVFDFRCWKSRLTWDMTNGNILAGLELQN